MNIDNTKSMYQQVADDLRHQIVTGELSPGQKLPTFEVLIAQYEVSRTIMQGAIWNGRGIYPETNHILFNKSYHTYFIADTAFFVSILNPSTLATILVIRQKCKKYATFIVIDMLHVPTNPLAS